LYHTSGGDNKVIFIKKVLCCGITKEGTPFVKEINYPYPKQTNFMLSPEDIDSDIDFGNLAIQQCDKELRSVLSKFKLIVVAHPTDASILREYSKSNNNNINICLRDRIISHYKNYTEL